MATETVDVDLSLQNVRTMTWKKLSTTNTEGAAAIYPQYADRNVMVTGTFGGGSIKIEGSNDNIKWFALTDMASSTISIIAEGFKMIQENVLYVRPALVGGDGTTALKVIIVGRKP